MTERADFLVNNRSPRYLHGFQKDTNETTELQHTVPVDNQVTYIDSFTNYGVDTVYGKEYVIAAGSSPTVHNSLPGRSDTDTHPASSITNTPAGNIAATTVQAAINELDSEKGGLATNNTWSGNNDFTSDIRSTAFIKQLGTSSQFLKADGSVDGSSYLTSNQTITISGDASGSGTTTIALSLSDTGVTDALLTGLNTSLTGTVAASDTILSALGKLENRVSGFSAAGVSSFNTRTGAVTLTSGDVTGALGYTPSADTHVHTFASLTSKPTTLAGYGITDAASSTHNHDTIYAKLSGATFTGSISATSGSFSGNLQYIGWVTGTSGQQIVPSSGGNYWVVGSSYGLIMRDLSGNNKGQVYFDSSGFGLLNFNGDWSVRLSTSSLGGGDLFRDWNCTGNLSSDKQIEAKGNGTAGGIILRNPSGDRYRLSINSSNALQLDAI